MTDILVPQRKQNGMALLEVIVAMLIFALAILPLVRLQVMSMDATKAGYYKTETAAAAQSIMDYLTTDRKSVFSGKWDKVVAISGSSECTGNKNSATEESSKENSPVQTACHMLDGENNDQRVKGNAIVCVYGKRPSYTKDDENVERDQYLISIRAIWYIGKRQEGKQFLNRDLKESDCGRNYDDKWDGDTKNYPDVLQKENIDYIKINMAY